MTAELSQGIRVVETLAQCLSAIGHPKRLEILQYCIGLRGFTDIILNLKMNPATFKFHVKILMDCGLIDRVSRGMYKTTELGIKMLELVKHANEIEQRVGPTENLDNRKLG